MVFWDGRKRAFGLLALLAVAMLVNSVSAQDGLGQLINMEQWRDIAVAVLLVTLTITTVSYMIAYAFGIEELKKWAKKEYMQILATVLLLGFLVVGMDVAWMVVEGVTRTMAKESFMEKMMTEGGWPGLVGEPFAISTIYIQNVINCEKKAYGRLYLASALLEPIQRHSIDVAGAGEAMSGWYLTGIVNMIHTMGNNLTFGIIAHYFQIELLKFTKVAMLTVFLPVGLILRTFPLTRGAGGLLIAIAIGFFFVFPVSYIVVLAGIDYNSFCEITEEDIPEELKQATCYTSPSDIVFQKSQAHAALGWIDRFVMRLQNTFIIIVLGIYSMVYAFIITLTFIRATSLFFGSDLAEIGRGLIKLI